MFKNQIKELKEMEVSLEGEIKFLEENVKQKKQELRDTKVAIASLEKLCKKYEKEEEVEDETVSVSV